MFIRCAVQEEQKTTFFLVVLFCMPFRDPCGVCFNYKSNATVYWIHMYTHYTYYIWLIWAIISLSFPLTSFVFLPLFPFRLLSNVIFCLKLGVYCTQSEGNDKRNIFFFFLPFTIQKQYKWTNIFWADKCFTIFGMCWRATRLVHQWMHTKTFSLSVE